MSRHIVSITSQEWTQRTCTLTELVSSSTAYKAIHYKLLNSIQLNKLNYRTHLIPKDGLKQIPRSAIILLHNLSSSTFNPDGCFCVSSSEKRIKRLDNWELNLSTTNSLLLWFPSPSHSLLCVVFSSKRFHCAHPCTQITIPDAFYRLKIAFSL